MWLPLLLEPEPEPEPLQGPQPPPAFWQTVDAVVSFTPEGSAFLSRSNLFDRGEDAFNVLHTPSGYASDPTWAPAYEPSSHS